MNSSIERRAHQLKRTFETKFVVKKENFTSFNCCGPILLVERSKKKWDLEKNAGFFFFCTATPHTTGLFTVSNSTFLRSTKANMIYSIHSNSPGTRRDNSEQWSMATTNTLPCSLGNSYEHPESRDGRIRGTRQPNTGTCQNVASTSTT